MQCFNAKLCIQWYNSTISSNLKTFYNQNQLTICEPTCPVGFYPSGSICAMCDASCLACNGAGSNACTACRAPSFLYTPTSTCYSGSCPQGYYGDSASQLCRACDNGCAQCTTSATTCSACASSYYLTPSATCVISTLCPYGTYANANR